MVPTGVAIVVTDQKGRCLLGQRLKDGSQGLFGLPGGSLEANETLEECAKRELHEEVGFPAVGVRLGYPEQLFAVAHEPGHSGSGKWVTVYFHVRCWTDEGAFQGPLWEGIPTRNLEPEKCVAWVWIEPWRNWSPSQLFGGDHTLTAMLQSTVKRLKRQG